MGLDSVELVMEVEEHFGIRFSDTQAERIRTVGDLVELCRQRIHTAITGRCYSLPCFLALRTATRDVVEDPTLRIRPATAVVDVLSPSARQALWERLESILGSAPDGLLRPRGLQRALLVVTFATTLVCAVALYGLAGFSFTLIAIILVVGIVTAILLQMVTQSWCILPPKGYATFGEITQQLVGGYAAVRPRVAADPSAILAELRPIIAEQLGIREDIIVPEASFVYDLGMD